MKFIIVGHEWFMESKGFFIEEIEAKDIESAWNIAHVMRSKKHCQFNSCAVQVIPIHETETMKAPCIFKKMFDLNCNISIQK